MIEITLGPDEVAIAQLVGERRWRSCVAANSPDIRYPRGAEAEAKAQDVNAAGSELAVAKLLDRYPYAFASIGSANRFADVGDKQVRHTHHKRGRLLIHPEDQDEQRFVFVVGTLPTFCVVGWIRAREAKQERFWTMQLGGVRLEHPCFAVPQEALRQIPEDVVVDWTAREVASRVG